MSQVYLLVLLIGMVVPLSSGDVVVELAILFLASLPTGGTILRLSERFLGRRLKITLLERALVSFYFTGGVLFLLASVPVAWYGSLAIVVLLSTGVAGYGIISVRDRGSNLRSVIEFIRAPVGLSIVLGTLALMVIETGAIWGIPLSNPYDGSMSAIWVNLTISGRSLPWTLAPYANWGVAYPLSTTIWMSVPVLLFGWSSSQTPLLLSPLFLSLTIPAAYCLGDRLASHGTLESRFFAPLCAAFFGLVASWPRLWVGGSYDFGFAFPLLLLMLGWARPFVEGRLRPWRDVVGFGCLLGILAALNAAAAQFLVLTLIGFMLAFRLPSAGGIVGWLVRIAASAATGLLFVIRSVVGIAVWYPFPGHVLQDTGNPPYVQPPIGYDFSPRLIAGELNPFVPWKAKLSPVPFLSVELQVLLSIGLVLLGLGLLLRSVRVRRALPLRAAETISAGLIVALLFTAALIVPLLAGAPFSSIEWITSLDEVSIILFTFFGLVAILPMASALMLLGSLRQVKTGNPDGPVPSPIRSRDSTAHSAARWGKSRSSKLFSAVLVLAVTVPLGSGALATVWSVPGYIQEKTLSTGNATLQDVAALQWAGGNLPACSRVLVAPGSAGQFLPEYANVGLVFPMLPVPVNLSYAVLVDDLIQGTYDSSTHSALLTLGITEVMGTGETFGGFPPFNLTGVLQSPSPDFKVLFEDGDASILGFLPGAALTGCPV